MQEFVSENMQGLTEKAQVSKLSVQKKRVGEDPGNDHVLAVQASV